MTTTEINRIIALNDLASVKDIYEKLYQKLTELNKRVDTATRNLIVTGFLWIVSTRARIESFDIGPVSINDISLFIGILPVAYGYFLYELVALSKNKGEVFQAVKTLAGFLFEKEHYDLSYSQTKHSTFIRALLPFSYSLDFSRVTSGKLPSLLRIFGGLLALPMPLILVGIFCLPFYMVNYLYLNKQGNLLMQLSFWITLWTVVVVVYYTIAGIAISFQQIRAGEQVIDD